MTNAALSDAEPKLDKPGAGLPIAEWFVAKYFILPKQLKLDTASAIQNFDKESRKIEALCAGLSEEQLTTKCLVKRLPGLEDSSRYWSIAMVLEHLVVVHTLMGQVTVALATNSSALANAPKTGTADVKPSGIMSGAEALAAFEKVRVDVLASINAVDANANPDKKHPHPWFGPLNARQWLIFLSLHSNIHRRQIIAIAEKLKSV
jgi:hypothetical protein